MTTTTPEEFLFGSGQTAKFEQIGQRHRGIVLSRPVTRPQTDYSTGKPKFWENGDPVEQMVIRLLTQEREDADDDGVRVLYIDNKRKKESLRDACRQVGAKRIEVGGVVDMAYTGDGPKEGGGNPPKLYWSAYELPTAETLAAIEAYLNGPGLPQQPQAPQPPSTQPNYGQPQGQPPWPQQQPAQQAQPQWGPPSQPAQGFPQQQPLTQAPPLAPVQAAWPQQQAPVPPPAPQPAPVSYTPEIIAAIRASNQDPKSIYPDYDGRYDQVAQR